MMYDKVMFNLHDVALILVAFQSLIFGSLLLTIVKGNVASSRLLGLFAFSVGLESVDTLIYWCAPLKELYLQDVPLLFFSLKVALLVQGPLLFLYVKSLIYADFTFHKKHLTHFLPALFYPFYVFVMAANIGEENLTQGVQSYSYYWDDPYYRSLVIIQSTVVVAYALASLRLMLGYKERLMETHSYLGEIERGWLRVLITGFTVICLWNLSAHLLGAVFSSSVSSIVGLTGNYVDLIFINLLVFYNLLHSHVVWGIKEASGKKECDESSNDEEGLIPPQQPAPSTAGEIAGEALAKQHVDAIERAIKQKQVFLVHDLTLDQLAAAAGLSPRAASNIINRHYGMNFFDFINLHRVEHAKALLIAEPKKSVLDVSELSGFNSKSAFHRFFKKFVAVTPTEYRRRGASTEDEASFAVNESPQLE